MKSAKARYSIFHIEGYRVKYMVSLYSGLDAFTLYIKMSFKQVAPARKCWKQESILNSSIQECCFQLNSHEDWHMLAHSIFLGGDNRSFDHSSRALRWRAFMWIQDRFSLINFSASFQSSTTPSATSRAHITVTLLPRPKKDCVRKSSIRISNRLERICHSITSCKNK